jgi:hypothetical protein
MCGMSPSAGTAAGGLHVELCVPNENHRAYSVVTVRGLLSNVVEPEPHLFHY